MSTSVDQVTHYLINVCVVQTVPWPLLLGAAHPRPPLLLCPRAPGGGGGGGAAGEVDGEHLAVGGGPLGEDPGQRIPVLEDLAPVQQPHILAETDNITNIQCPLSLFSNVRRLLRIL